MLVSPPEIHHHSPPQSVTGVWTCKKKMFKKNASPSAFNPIVRVSCNEVRIPRSQQPSFSFPLDFVVSHCLFHGENFNRKLSVGRKHKKYLITTVNPIHIYTSITTLLLFLSSSPKLFRQTEEKREDSREPLRTPALR